MVTKDMQIKSECDPLEKQIDSNLQYLQNKEGYSNKLNKINEDIQRLIADHATVTDIDLNNLAAVDERGQQIIENSKAHLKNLDDNKKVLQNLIILEEFKNTLDKLNNCLKSVVNPSGKMNKDVVPLLEIDDSEKKAWLLIISNG
jgi:hypothetical protein